MCHAKFGPNDHRKDAPPFTYWNRFEPLKKIEGRVNNGKFAVKAAKAKSNESNQESGFDEEGRMIVAEDEKDDARKFPCPECDFVFLRNVFFNFRLKQFPIRAP